MTAPVYDLTAAQRHRERLESPELQSCWAGNELRARLDELTEKRETVCRQRELVAAQKLKATAGPAKRLTRLLDAIEALKELAAKTADEISATERPYDEQYDRLDGEAMRLADEIGKERHKLRAISELTDQVKGYANG